MRASCQKPERRLLLTDSSGISSELPPQAASALTTAVSSPNCRASAASTVGSGSTRGARWVSAGSTGVRAASVSSKTISSSGVSSSSTSWPLRKSSSVARALTSAGSFSRAGAGSSTTGGAGSGAGAGAGREAWRLAACSAASRAK